METNLTLEAKAEAVVTLLNCVFEMCFTQKEIEEEYSGDLVGEFGVYYDLEDKKVRDVIADYSFKIDGLFNKLFVRKMSAFEVLDKYFLWDTLSRQDEYNKQFEEKKHGFSEYYKDLLKSNGLKYE